VGRVEAAGDRERGAREKAARHRDLTGSMRDRFESMRCRIEQTPSLMQEMYCLISRTLTFGNGIDCPSHRTRYRPALISCRMVVTRGPRRIARAVARSTPYVVSACAGAAGSIPRSRNHVIASRIASSIGPVVYPSSRRADDRAHAAQP
jgi:hypothetical protein